MLTTIEKILFLKSVPLFANLSGEELRYVADIAEEIKIDKDTIIFNENEIGDTLYLIIKGKVKISKDGKEITVLGEKECFGEMAILDNEPRSATASVIEDSEVLVIEKDDFFDLLSEKFEIAQGVINVLCKRLRETTSQQLKEKK
jgi:CRP-like cAMP-binding protein